MRPNRSATPILVLLTCVFVAASSVPLAHPDGEAQPTGAPPNTPSNPSGAWADYDGDGLLDLYWIGAPGENRLLRNTGDGEFMDVTVESGLDEHRSHRSALWADFDSDGHVDLLLGGPGHAATILRGTDSAVFEDVTATAGLDGVEDVRAARTLDFDLDGLPDLWIEGTTSGQIYRNGGECSFHRVLTIPIAPDANRTAFASAPPRVVKVPDEAPKPAYDPGKGQAEGPTGARPAPSLPKRSGTSVSRLAPAGGFGLCATALVDQGASGACLKASSIPMEGALFPLGRDLFVDPSGRVGIGTTNPSRLLDVAGVLEADEITVGDFRWRESGAGLDMFYGPLSGESTLRLFGNMNSTLDVLLDGNMEVGWGGSGDLTVNGNTTTRVLTITGGSDLVEGFDADEDLEPGTVVVLDPDGDGRVVPSRAPYDTGVAGVVSGACGVRPGIRLGQEGVLDGDTSVAMTGRVYVKCSAENGPVRPGDLLTTAAVPGHAMRVTDHSRASFAVIGKAMSSLDEGTGLVLVVVNLQ